MILVIDNSLKVDNVKGIVDALVKLGVSNYRVIKDHAQLAKVRPATVVKGIILSGSEMMVTDTDMHKYADKFMLNMTVLARFDVPVLAICFGCQLVNHVFGGSMRKLEHKLSKVMPVKLYHKGHKRNAKFNCKYVIDKVSPDMEAVGSVVHNGKEITCLIKHKTRPITGTLFHPEACDDTMEIIGMG